MTAPRKKPPASSVRGAKRYWVSISAAQFNALQEMGMEQDRSVPWLLGRALAGPLRCVGDCADCIAERAGI